MGLSSDTISGVEVTVRGHGRTLAPALSCQLSIHGRGGTRPSPVGSRNGVPGLAVGNVNQGKLGEGFTTSLSLMLVSPLAYCV